MTSARENISLSRLEIVVLARLSAPKAPTDAALLSDVKRYAELDESPGRASEIVAGVLGAFVDYGLVNEKRQLLPEGTRLLRSELGLSRTPLWTEFQKTYLPAIALGLEPGGPRAAKVIKDAATIARAVLGAQVNKADAPLSVICNAFIAEALGLPASTSMDRVRAHVLARRAGIEAKGTLAQIAVRAAAKVIDAPEANKRGLVPTLSRRWVRSEPKRCGPSSKNLGATTPPVGVDPGRLEPLRSHEESKGTTGNGTALLTAVRELLPRVGADGRHGPEKVFVSAIWRSLGRDRRVPDLSLDYFKRWLLNANRDGWLVLARADVVSALDSKLVSESLIEDRGATFHFVLDQSSGSGRSFHAR